MLLSLSTVAEDGKKQTPVRVANVERSQNISEMTFTGTVLSEQQASLSSEIAGRIDWMIDLGNRVNKGDLLIKLNDASLQLDADASKSTLIRLKANSQLRHRQFERLTSLASSNAAAAQQLDEVEFQAIIADQELELEEINLKHIQLQISHSKINAPFSGQIIERLRNPSEYIDAGRELIRIIGAGNKEIRVQIPIAMASKIDVGTNIRANSNQRQQESIIKSILSNGDEVSRMLEIRIPIGDHWILGEAVTVSIPQPNTRYSLSIPRDAIVLRKNEQYVYRIDDENIAHQVSVITRKTLGDRIWVSGELQIGDRVVIRGAERLQAGDQVVHEG